MNHLEKKYFFEKIAASATFSNSNKLVELLKYLFEASEKNSSVKEINIAEDVFERKSNFNQSEDTIVRVNIHKLRKKLETYYEREGHSDTIKIKVPKGKYTVEFTSKPASKLSIYKLRILFTFCVLFFVATVCLAFALFSLNKQIGPLEKIPRSNPIWNGVLDSHQPPIIALGDHFFYTMKHPDLKRQVYVRDFVINNEKDFKKLLGGFPQFKTDYNKLDFTYFSKSNVWPLSEIIQVLVPYFAKTHLRVASKLSPEDMKKNNIIFLGNVKTIGPFSIFLNQSSIRCNIDPFYFSFVPEKSDTAIVVKPYGIPPFDESISISSTFHTDYSFLVKVPGPSQNSILFLCDLLSTGSIGAVEYLSDIDLLMQLENLLTNKYGYCPEFFEVVFKTEGFNRTNFKTAIIHFNEIRQVN